MPLRGRAGLQPPLLASVDAELMRERGAALGRAGRRLELAIADYRYAVAVAGGGLSADDEDELIAAICEFTYRLMVQRECLGFRHDNLAWIRASYDLPGAALRRL